MCHNRGDGTCLIEGSMSGCGLYCYGHVLILLGWCLEVGLSKRQKVEV